MYTNIFSISAFKIKQAEINQAVYINFLNHLNNTSFLKLRIFIIY